MNETTGAKGVVGPDLERLRRERGELWLWVHRLERLAEAGLQARGLAHDLGNTLTSLMAGSELALQQEDTRAFRKTLQRNLDLSRTAARRLHAFVEITSRGERSHRDRNPLPDVVEETIRFLSHPLRKAQVEIECSYASDACVPGSRPELLQVVGTALLGVLAGYGVSGGILEIRVEEAEDDVSVEFHRAAVSGTPVEQGPWWTRGTGLETTVARRIAASLGGRIDVEPGASHARIVLPVVRQGGVHPSWRESPAAFGHHPAENRARHA